jgi:hypothetical protein
MKDIKTGEYHCQEIPSEYIVAEKNEQDGLAILTMAADDVDYIVVLDKDDAVQFAREILEMLDSEE